MEKIDRADGITKARANFLDFVKAVWPNFIMGRHHHTMAKAIEDLVDGRETRTIVNLPPRFSKSEMFSYMMPAWFLGKYPNKKVIMTCSTADLAQGFSRKIRNLISSEEYQRIFPGVELSQDSKSVSRWHTGQGGEMFAVGAEGNITGKGADLLLIDDPTGEQQAVAAIGDPSIYDKVYDWYIAGPRQRLQPNGRVCVVQSRWAVNDFTGRLVKAQIQSDAPNADKWNVIELPALLPSGESLWPEFWSLKLLEGTKAALPADRWNAQYMQRPSSSGSSLIRPEWWQPWTFRKPPVCEITMLSGDLAFTANNTSDYSAFTLWGIFPAPIPDRKDPAITHPAHHIILLDAWRERLEFPDLKKEVYRYWSEKKPDMFLLENKGSGISLIQELRSMGIPVMAHTPNKGTRFQSNDKIARVNAVTDIFASGMVWAPAIKDEEDSEPIWTRFAAEVIEEVGEFPGSLHDDYTDTVSQALTRFRQGGFIRLTADEYDDGPVKKRTAAYY